MKDQRQYKVTMFLAIWQANFIGLAYGVWLFTGANDAGPMISWMIVALWFVSIHVIWTRALRMFWLEDFTRQSGNS